MTNEYSAFDNILADFISQQDLGEIKAPVQESIGFEEAIRRSESDLDDVLRQYVQAEPEKPKPNYEPIGFEEAIRRSENDLTDILHQYVPEEPKKTRIPRESIGFEEAIRRSENDLTDVLRRYVPEAPEKPVQEQNEINSQNEADVLTYGYAASQISDETDDVRLYSPHKKEKAQEIDFDPRFNLGGRRSYDGISYGGKKVDMSADENYIPRAQTGYSPRQWTDDKIDLSEAEEEARKKGLFKRFRKSDKSGPTEDLGRSEVRTEAAYDVPNEYAAYSDSESKRSAYARSHEYSEGLSDSSVSPADYADSYDYEEYEKPRKKMKSGKRGKDEFDFDYDGEDSGVFPGSFREYLSSIFASFLYRLHRSNVSDLATYEDDEEELGPELRPAEASKYYGNYANTLHLRLRISVVLLSILCYISLDLPVLGTLKSITVTAAACMAVQFTIMLLCLDVVTTGVLNSCRLRVGAEGLAVLSCLITTVDCLVIIYSDFGAPHIPLCAISSLSLVGVTFATMLSARGLRKALRVPAIGKIRFSITAATGSRDEGITLIKNDSAIKNFVRRSEEASPDETVFIKAAPFLIAASLLMTCIVALVKRDMNNFIYILSLFTAAAVPFCAILCFALPFFIGSNRIFSSGASIAGWSGLCDVGKSRNIIVTDSDLFPKGTVEIERVRVFADEDSNKVISYAGTLICAAGLACSPCFEELMEKNGCSVCNADSVEYLPGGGISGFIDGHTVLCGSTDLMYLMNVRVPFRFIDKTTVMLAIDGVLYGIFNLSYKPLPEVRQALISLMRSSRHPIFAVRDFNINPEMLHSCFDIATDGYDFPPYAERVAMTSERTKNDSKIAAVVCREGLNAMTHMADTGHSMYVATKINLGVTLISTVLGMLTVFIRLLGSGSVSVAFMLIFMLIWAVPVFVCSFYMPTR